MDSSLVPEVVEILRKDYLIVNELRRFATYLDTNHDDVSVWQTQRISGIITTYDFIGNVVQSWRCRNGDDATINCLCEILRGKEYIASAENLEKLENPGSSSKLWSYGILQEVVSNFKGRTDERNKLRTYFDTAGGKLVVISGLGGTGKTQLAKKFAEDVQTKACLLWLRGDLPENFRSSITSFAEKHLRLPTAQVELPLKDIGNRIIEKLKLQFKSSTAKLLVVIDNVDTEHQDFINIAKLFMNTVQAFVIVTSRKRNILSAERKDMKPLFGLEDDDAADLVRSELTNESDDSIRQLCKTLDNFPLVLQQAIAYIKEQKNESLDGDEYSIQNFMEDFQEKEQEKSILSKHLQLQEYEYATYTVWNLTVDKMTAIHGGHGQLAFNILQALAFVNADGITVKFLTELIRGILGEFLRPSPPPTTEVEFTTNEEGILESLKILKTYCLVNADRSIVSIHRVVQQMTRIRSNETDSSNNREDEESFSRRLKQPEVLSMLIDNLDVKSLWAAEIKHFVSIWTHCSADRALVKKYSYIPISICNRLIDLSMAREACSLAQKNLPLITTIMGPNHDQTMNLEHTLARTLHESGLYQEAEVQYKSSFEKQKVHREENHMSTLNTAHSLAHCLISVKKCQEAVTMANFLMRVKTEKKISTESTKLILAHALGRLNKQEESMKLFQELMVYLKKHKQEKSSFAFFIRNGIGVSLQKQGKLVEARAEFENVVRLREAILPLGGRNMHTLHSKYMLAKNFSLQGENTQALAMMEEILPQQVQVLGESHPDVVRTKGAIIVVKGILQENTG